MKDNLSIVENIFETKPRELWKEEIRDLVETKSLFHENTESVTPIRCDFDENDKDEYLGYFTLDQLDKNYQFSFNIGDIVKSKEDGGIYIINELPPLDRRYTGVTKGNYITQFGNLYELVGVVNEKKVSYPINESIRYDNNLEPINIKLVQFEVLWFLREFTFGKYRFWDCVTPMEKIFSKYNIDYTLGSTKSKDILENEIFVKVTN